jgi:hypothetical protein
VGFISGRAQRSLDVLQIWWLMMDWLMRWVSARVIAFLLKRYDQDDFTSDFVETVGATESEPTLVAPVRDAARLSAVAQHKRQVPRLRLVSIIDPLPSTLD